MRWVAFESGKSILPLLFFAGLLGFLIWSYFRLPMEARRRRLGAIIATVGVVIGEIAWILYQSREDPESVCGAMLALFLGAWACIGVGGYLIFRKPRS
jgi:uncharacterized BrkB/YihY/UPF0761 family membrane protein